MKTNLAMILLGALGLAGGRVLADERTVNPQTIYFTVGDAQDLLYTPLESKSSIESVFDVLHEKYKLHRVWWRGGQDEIWGNQFVLREQNRYYWRVWNWWRDLQYRVVKCNQLAVEAAHKRGMEIWMAYGLFDNGSPPDVGFVGFPYAAEDKIRVEHPEWAPVNKYGTWRQGGPIEFYYEGARKAMVQYLTKYTVEGNYDGIAFLTYAENYSQRYEEEFGYNQPIVDEFKKRYGVDIRAESFDKVAWTKLRGEYLTQFFRELHASLSAHGKKIAMSVDGQYPYWPCRWGGAKGVRTAGKLWMDVETWVREGIIDELNLFHPVNEASVQKCNALCKGTATKLSAWGGAKLPPDADQLLTLNFDIESGLDNWQDFYAERIPLQPLEALKSPDVYARRRILCAVEKGKQTVPAVEVIPLTRDADVLVRRAALRALGTLKDPSTLPAIEAALLDEENSVRWQAALVLGQLNAPHCIERIFDAVALSNSTFQFNLRAVPTVLNDLKEKKHLTSDQISFIVGLTSAPEEKVRETAWNALRAIDAPRTETLGKAILKTLDSEPDPYARELALAILQNFPPTPAYLDAISRSMKDDRDAVVQVRACRALATIVRQDSGQPAREHVLDSLVTFFGQYGDGCERADKDWGWRDVGNSIRSFGQAGNRALERIMKDTEHKQLADLAWRVVYLKQEDGFTPLTEEQERLDHLKHPFLKFGKGQ
jgi:HEAT repeat protein